MKQTKECCWRCLRGELVNKDTYKEYPKIVCIDKKCKCHSPKVSKSWNKDSKGQEGEVCSPSFLLKDLAENQVKRFYKKNKKLMDSLGDSPSSFDIPYINKDMDGVRKRFRSIVERDYIEKTISNREAMSQYQQGCIDGSNEEKQKVIDDYKILDKMLIVLKSVTPKDSEGYKILKKWIKHFGQRKKELKL